MTYRISDCPGYRVLMRLMHGVLQLLTKGYIAVTVLKGAGKVWGCRGTDEQGKKSVVSLGFHIPPIPGMPEKLRQILLGDLSESRLMSR